MYIHHTCGDSAIDYLYVAVRIMIDACILFLQVYKCMYVCTVCVWTAVMWSDIVERAERDRLYGHTSARLGMIVNLSIHFLPNSCIECRLLGPAATPPRPLALLLPPLVAVFPDRYKKNNRKHNFYSMSMIWTHTYIDTYIHTYIHTYIYYIHTYIQNKQTNKQKNKQTKKQTNKKDKRI